MVKKVKLQDIKYIIHISDIHVRLLKRHTEYKLVFDKLYQYIDSNILNGTFNAENTIVVISGDIVHSKTEMSPEMIDLVSEFIENLAKRLTLCIIPGNHDANLNNKNRLDALTPIINLLTSQYDSINYYRDSGIYKLSNIDFIVMSVFDDIYTSIDKSKLRKDSKKIVLYHGTVNGSKTDLGYTLKNDKINLPVFDNTDMVLLGDIHLRQKLQTYHITDDGIKKPTIAYCGSTIQQNHGEEFCNHGILIWDLSKNDYTEVNLDNDFGYYTATVKDNQLFLTGGTIPKSPRLRIIVEDDTPRSIVKELVTDLKKQSNIQSVVISTPNKKASKTVVTETGFEIVEGNKIEDIIGNIKNVHFQNELIEKYLLNKYPNLTSEILSAIKDININLNNTIKLSSTNRNIVFKLLKFEFSNMFSYGENNSIDFTDMTDINGLMGHNAIGKSAVVSAILYCLFDKCERANRAIDVMNYNKDNFNCKLSFLLNNITYYIERIATKDKKGKVSVVVDFYFYDDENNKQSLNGDKRDTTNANIRTYIGTYDNMVLTTFSTQGNDGGLIHTTQATRRGQPDL